MYLVGKALTVQVMRYDHRAHFSPTMQLNSKKLQVTRSQRSYPSETDPYKYDVRGFPFHPGFIVRLFGNSVSIHTRDRRA